MRVVAGLAGGIPLRSPKGVELRPTMDLVRGAIFSALGEQVIGAHVLDLFAGTGALGIEAMSRGAGSATLVEKHPRAVETIRENLEKTRLSAQVVNSDVFKYLNGTPPAEGFNLILADPPYAKYPGERDFGGELLALETLPGWLAPTGIFILEHLPGAELALGERWELLRQKRYGATEVAFLAAR